MKFLSGLVERAADLLPKARRQRREKEHKGATQSFAQELHELQAPKDPDGNTIKDELGYEIHKRFENLRRHCDSELLRIFSNAISSLRVDAAVEIELTNKILGRYDVWSELSTKTDEWSMVLT